MATETNPILSAIREIAKTESLLRASEIRTFRYADDFSDNWLVKQRKKEAAYMEKIQAAKRELLGYARRVSPSDKGLIREHLSACRARLSWSWGAPLRYVAGWGEILHIRLRPDAAAVVGAGVSS